MRRDRLKNARRQPAPLMAVALVLIACSLSSCQPKQEQHAHVEAHKVLVTSPLAKDVVLTQEYVCVIHSQRHIDVCALEDGYLEPIPIKEGQRVKQGDLLFKIVPTLYQAKLDAELAEVRAAQVELEQAEKLLVDKIVSKVDVALHKAKLSKARGSSGSRPGGTQFYGGSSLIRRHYRSST